ncbi:hypothetical protein [Cellulomonas sp. URHE0023]|uniref:hypothetical protein n=1 Tax=Cellulomonas sp. URHE0023 TaxID=1380354 RepID=UPI000487364B|nr:hypothetical protein [Cellulomonas sp. URHE0023]
MTRFVLLASLTVCGLFAAIALASLARRRRFANGLRGTAVVVDVRPVPRVRGGWVQPRNTDIVTVATAAWPRGVPVRQEPPSHECRVGQVVPVVQEAGRPDVLYLDRADLEPPLSSVLRPVGFLLVAPVILVLGLTR